MERAPGVPRGTESARSAVEGVAGPLAAGIQALELEISEAQRAQLLALVELVHIWAQKLNLTGHRTPREITEGLLLDALALERQLPATAGVADLGSGAGFPGLPLAILRPATRVLLVDSRRRRHHFQRSAVRSLDLENTEPILGRAEELAPMPQPLAVAQALAPAERAVELMLPWVEVGGCLALPGSENPSSFPADARLESPVLRRYTVPPGGRLRSLWLARRTS